MLSKRTKGRRGTDGSVSVTFTRMSSSLVGLKMPFSKNKKKEGGGGDGLFFDSRKVPANTSLTNGLRRAGFDLFLMALM